MLKKIILLGIIISFVLLAGCTSRSPEIAVLDIEEVLARSRRAQELQEELLNIGNTLEEEYSQQEDEEEDQNHLERVYQEYLSNKQRLENSFNEEVKVVIEEIRKDKNIDTVLYKDSVYYGGLDITEKLVEMLDSKYDEEEGSDNDRE
ncbi:OmpH family outer membrane protein [Halocella sp. SP3-1]|uniref:OmpH family outer membrane protein n=1 Tax=Halocella sp. SP3-1 TaxID=2382161 RepID=UPI000F763559|nr:OmpH family outer membrane protein [Halocella sp. SP3-1]AZO93963.1 OmpH family outer membrane protein [Halocella sp. SP3-1]